MKHVDEFRDPALGQALAGEILGLVEPGRHYKFMEVCGGHTHSIYKFGIDDLLPVERRARARAGLPGLRDPDGPRRRRDRPRARGQRDLHVLRRHAARARLRRLAAGRQGRGRRHPDGLLAAGRAADRQGEPRPRRHLHGDRLRDDRAVDGADAQAREGRGRAELLLHVQPRDDRAAAARAARLAGPAPRRLHRPGPRVDRRRRPPVRVHPGASTASRSPSPASSRSTCCTRSTCCSRSSRRVAARSRTSTPASCRGRATSRALQVMGEVFELRPHFEWRGMGFISQSGLKLSKAYADLDAEIRYARPRRARRRSRRPASAARSSRASSSRGSARSSAPAARRSARSAPAWCPARAPAPRTTTTGASPASARSSSALGGLRA